MLKKLIMYVSAFLPMFFIMWFRDVLICIRNVIETPYKYSWASVYLNPYLLVEIVIIVLIGVTFFWLLRHNKETGTYVVKLKGVKNRTAEYYIEYYSLFILALIEFSLTDPIDLAVLVLLLIVLGVVYIKNDLFYINPTVNIFQSYIYEIEYDYECGATKETIAKLVISPEKLTVGNTINISISEFEFTFFRKRCGGYYGKRN